MGRPSDDFRFPVGAVNLDVLADICQGLAWPDGIVPSHPEARRLMEALGVTGLPEDGVTGVQELTETRVCAQPLCTVDAMRMSLWCRRHAPVAELAAGRVNGHEADGLAALQAMDNGEPQRPLGEPGGSTPRESAKGAVAAVLAEPGSPNAKKHSHNPWTREQVIAAIQRWTAEHDGQPPSSGKAPDSWQRKQGDYPTCASCVSLFGSWRAAIEAAGFKTRPRRPAPASGGRPKRQVRAARAPENQAGSPMTVEVSPPSPAMVRKESRTGELVLSEPEHPLDLPAAAADQGLDSGSLSTHPFAGLALTGDFHRDAQRARVEATRLRAQADALDTIAAGIQALAETVA